MNVILRNVDKATWDAFRARATSNGRSPHRTVLELIADYGAGHIALPLPGRTGKTLETNGWRLSAGPFREPEPETAYCGEQLVGGWCKRPRGHEGRHACS